MHYALVVMILNCCHEVLPACQGLVCQVQDGCCAKERQLAKLTVLSSDRGTGTSMLNNRPSATFKACKSCFAVLMLRGSIQSTTVG